MLEGKELVRVGSCHRNSTYNSVEGFPLLWGNELAKPLVARREVLQQEAFHSSFASFFVHLCYFHQAGKRLLD